MIDARLMADLFRYYAGMAPEIDGVTRSVSPPEHTPKHVTIVREPAKSPNRPCEQTALPASMP